MYWIVFGWARGAWRTLVDRDIPAALFINWMRQSPREVTVPYASGEVPALGDYVKNKWEQPGTVIEVKLQLGAVSELVSIRWDDGGRDLPLTPATEFTLVSRQV
jgi:hypothetical protein